MRFAKFIIVKKNGFESAIPVHPGVSHDEAVNADRLKSEGGAVLSAGFFAITEDGSVFVDEDLPSTSLKLRPRPDDADIIARTLFLMGLRSTPLAAGTPKLSPHPTLAHVRD